MSKVVITPGVAAVTVTMNENQADSLSSLLENFFIPKAADTGLNELRKSLRGADLGGTGLKITANRGGRKPYAIAG